MISDYGRRKHVCVCTLRCKLTRTHHTLTNRSPCEWYVPLEKTYRRKSSSGLSTQPQEPRRPRFSFFQSSQCQRTDPVCGSRRRRQWKHSFRILQNRNHPRLPGSSSALSGSLNSGSETRSASSTWRVVFKTFTSVNSPFSSFGRPDFRKPEVANFLVLSVVCFSLWRRFRRRVPQQRGGL